jgi:hypothetical protein
VTSETHVVSCARTTHAPEPPIVGVTKREVTVTDAIHVAAAPHWPSWLRVRLGRLLGHPLLLLLVGAYISALIVPPFTQRWQTHQRQLDVQAMLTSEMTKQTSAFLTACRLALDDSKYREAHLDDAWRQWETDSAVSRAKLRAYYPRREDLVQEWKALDQAVIGFHMLATGSSEFGRVHIEDALNVELPKNDLALRHDALAAIERAEDELVWRVLKTAPRV